MKQKSSGIPKNGRRQREEAWYKEREKGKRIEYEWYRSREKRIFSYGFILNV